MNIFLSHFKFNKVYPLPISDHVNFDFDVYSNTLDKLHIIGRKG